MRICEKRFTGIFWLNLPWCVAPPGLRTCGYASGTAGRAGLSDSAVSRGLVVDSARVGPLSPAAQAPRS
jgi:hypothetical protein